MVGKPNLIVGVFVAVMAIAIYFSMTAYKWW